MSKKNISVLLIEDDLTECKIYKDITKNREDINIVSITNSSIKAIEDVKKYTPNAIILDLELNDGEGSGFDFIERFKELKFKSIPEIVVTTNVHSDSVYDFCHKNNIDFVFYKGQKNYSRENILNTIVLLNDYDNVNITKVIDSNEEKVQDNIVCIIEKELDLIGISTHLSGRKYLAEGIQYIILTEGKDKVSIIQHLVGKYKRSSSTISRAMQNAIIHAWRITPIEDLTKYYTARVNYETGIPTPTEFLYYYADKIKKQL